MKMFDWLNRKTKKKSQAEIHAADHHQQEQIKNPSLELHAKSLPVKLSSESKAAFDYFKGTEEQPKKRREIVKIFVNHEEYGLLAIGTLGLYELTEIELFEVKPQRHGQSLQEQNKHEEKKAEESEVDEKVSGALVLHKDSKAAAAAEKKKKKLFSLDPHVRSKLLHPLNYLNFGRNNEVCSTNSDQNNAKEKSKNVSLFKKLLAGKGHGISSSSCTKQITNPTSSSREVQPSSQPTGSRCQSKLKKAMSQFSCLSVQVEQNSSDEEEEPAVHELHVNAGALSTPDSACSARGDPNAGHQQACGKDMRPEYWIRTDSDYVVLEL